MVGRWTRWGSAGALLAAGCRPSADPGDLRPEAVAVVELSRTGSTPLTVADVLGAEVKVAEPPATVRVWRRRRGRTGRPERRESSCEGRVEVLGLEEYVEGVVPAEWMASWEPEALRAGAIAARTYASFWVAVGGRYQCADVDDSTWTQVYLDERFPPTSDAVRATEGAVAVIGGSLVFAEYSAENGTQTGFGVHDPHCRGRPVEGHTRGVCQWGTQEWALRGKDPEWMIAHYYPGARVAWPGEELLDGVDLTVRSGERFELALSATNVESAPWPRGGVWVGTDSRAFVAPDWEAPDRPVSLAHEVGQHQTARLAWRMVAPEVEVPTTFAEFFWLGGAAADRPGAEGSWRITVFPPVAPPVAPASGRPSPVAFGAALVALALAAAGLWSRRGRGAAVRPARGADSVEPAGLPRPYGGRR